LLYLKEKQALLDVDEISRNLKRIYSTDISACHHCQDKENAAIVSAIVFCFLTESSLVLKKWIETARLAALCHVQPDLLDMIECEKREIAEWLVKVLLEKDAKPPVSINPEEAKALQHALELSHLAAQAKNQEQETKYSDLKSVKVGLLYGGATRIKEYVFESSKLPEIRGASALLDYINITLVPALFKKPDPHEFSDTYQRLEKYGASFELVPECLIYANGGEFLAFSPVSQTAALAQNIERIYALETMSAQAVVVGETFSLYEIATGLAEPDQQLPPRLENLKIKGFGNIVSYLSVLRYKRREFNPILLRDGSLREERHVATFDTFAPARRCDSCDQRTAILEAPQIEAEQPRRLCEACARKTAVGQRLREKRGGKWLADKGFSWQIPLDLPDWAEKINKLNGGRARLANDLTEIAQASQPNGFIGVVYADGNNMGGLLQEIKTPSHYRQFAQAVYAVLLDTVVETLESKLEPRSSNEGELYYPFEILSVGGDDLYLFVPASSAIEIALEICERVEKKLAEIELFKIAANFSPEKIERYEPKVGWKRKETQSKVALSGGVILAPASTPVFFLDQLVQELLKSAKKKAVSLRKQCYQGGTLDFMALKSVTMVNDRVADWRKETLILVNKSKNKTLRLTGRPYTLPEIAGLLTSVKTLKNELDESFRAQLYRLRDQLGKGELSGRINYLYLVAQAGEKGLELEKELNRWVGNDTNKPWRIISSNEDHKILETVIADLVELYDFTPGKVSERIKE